MADDGAGLEEAAGTAVHQCLNLGPEESCLVVTDGERRPVGEALYRVAREVSDDAVVSRYPPGDQHGEEPPASVAAAMAAADVVFAPTTRSLSHTRARGDANDAGARIATLPGITEAVMVAGLDADYDAVAGHCESVRAQVADAEEVRVRTEAGTDVTFRPGDREWHADTGVVHEAGGMTNLPAGEVYVSPADADGTCVVDGTMMPHGRLAEGERIRFEVENGRVTSVSDDEIRAQIEAAAEAVGDAAYNVAELGIGTNVAVTDLVGSVLLDEKAAGTVHVAVGDDAGIGGETEAPIHLDGIVREPTVYADGEPIDLPA